MKRLDLCGSWKFKEAGSDKSYHAQVPGSVYQDMLSNKLIDDPYWRVNEYSAREVMAKDYIYEKTFKVEEKDLSLDSATLVFTGLDTIADVTLNEHMILSASDMHRTYKVDVKKYLKAGDNSISIYFHSALTAAREEAKRNPIVYYSTGSTANTGGIRKAHFSFGWDWAPQLPDAGIFRPAYIEFSSIAKIEDVKIKQIHENGSVRLSVKAELMEMRKDSGAFVSVTLEDPDGKIFRAEGENVEFLIESPKLWWPNNIGPQNLYDVCVILYSKGRRKLDTRNFSIGLRTIELSRDEDEIGSEFAFKVNGIKIFAMGANYVPQDSIISRVKDEDYQKIVEDAKRANFNMIRVWGGGYYPSDAFYDACDKNGILIWQDLMFACNVYELNDSFEENIIEETKDNLRRIRHHASLALICTNNEMEWIFSQPNNRIQRDKVKYKAEYIKIFEFILPRVSHSVAPTVPVLLSSPTSTGSFDNPNDPLRGDQHYWDVWHSGKPFTEYRKYLFRFCSEYGFQSFPSPKTIASFSIQEDRNLFSKVMESHQKNGAANSKIFQYVSDYYKYPKDMDAISYISQVLQLKAIEYGVEHWRKNRGKCMGSLYWQLNDSWPVASWASIDYFGRWKALHYGARRFYAPVAVAAYEKEEFSPIITYAVFNETRWDVKRRISVDLIDRDFNIIRHEERDITAPSFSSTDAMTLDFSSELDSVEKKESIFARVRMYDGDKLEGERVTLFTKPKYFAFKKPSYSVDIRTSDDDVLITVKADTFANYVELDFRDFDVVLSDNFFDITSKEGVTVSVKKEALPPWAEITDIKRNLLIKSVRESFI